jgi:hypothetical protein
MRTPWWITGSWVLSFTGCGPTPGDAETGSSDEGGPTDDASGETGVPTSEGPLTTATTTASDTGPATSETGEATSEASDDDATTAGETGVVPAGCEVVDIPDSSLRAQIREALALPEGPITGEAMAALTQLSVSGHDVKSLVGIECAVGLEGLSVGDGDYLPISSDLPLIGGLPKLERLKLRYTSVSDLTPLAGTTTLRELDLEYTKVSDLTVLVGLSQLRVLNVNETDVGDLTPLAGLSLLEEVHAGDTKVVDLTALVGLPELRQLSLYWTDVADLAPLAGLGKLELLNLDSTAITDLGPLAGLGGLQVLAISGTAIADLSPLTGLPITGLHASWCQIVDITPIASFPTPGRLDLSYNQIVELDALAGVDWFVEDDSCGELILSGNPLGIPALETIPTFCTQTRVFAGGLDVPCMGALKCPDTY